MAVHRASERSAVWPYTQFLDERTAGRSVSGGGSPGQIPVMRVAVLWRSAGAGPAGIFLVEDQVARSPHFGNSGGVSGRTVLWWLAGVCGGPHGLIIMSDRVGGPGDDVDRADRVSAV